MTDTVTLRAALAASGDTNLVAMSENLSDYSLVTLDLLMRERREEEAEHARKLHFQERAERAYDDPNFADAMERDSMERGPDRETPQW